MKDFKDPKKPFRIVERALKDVTRREAYKDLNLYLHDYVAYTADIFEDEDGEEYKVIMLEVQIAAEDPPTATEWTLGGWFHGFLGNTKILQFRLVGVHVDAGELIYRFSGAYALYD